MTITLGERPNSIRDYLAEGGDPMQLDRAETIVDDVVYSARIDAEDMARFHRVILAAIENDRYLDVVPPRATEPRYPSAEVLEMEKRADLWRSTTTLALLEDEHLRARFEAALPPDVFAKALAEVDDYYREFPD